MGISDAIFIFMQPKTNDFCLLLYPLLSGYPQSQVAILPRNHFPAIFRGYLEFLRKMHKHI